MKFTCTKENLSSALNTVCSVAARQSNLPILTNIFISVGESKVEFIATDLEVAIKTSLRARVETVGKFTVPAKTLLDYVSLLTDEQVEICLKGNEIVVKSGNSSTKIKGSSADEYPVIPEIVEDHPFLLLAEPFKESLSKVVFAAAKNEIRPELSGVYFGFFTERYNGLVLAATDSYRLVEKRMSVAQGSGEIKSIVPVKTVQEIIKLISNVKPEEAENQVRLWVGGNQLAIRYGQCELTSRLIDGLYPDYVQIVPESFKTTATVPVSVLQKSIKAASLFTTMGVNAVSFDVNAESGSVSISSANTQTGEHMSEIDANVAGEENSILLNHKYVLDGLSHLNTDEADFKLNSSDAPCLFTPKGKEDYLYVVMPIRQ